MTSSSETPDMALTPVAELLGRRLVRYDPQSGTAVLEFLARPEFANRHGTVQGGILAAMLDSATGASLMAGLPANLTAVTRELDTSFVKPAPIGPLRATARIVARDDRDAQVEAEITTADGVVVARATATLKIIVRK
jgi:uncharacterized protein (TIGR00369 family)